jgi:hypothetical protein
MASETVAWWMFGGDREDWRLPSGPMWLQLVWLRVLAISRVGQCHRRYVARGKRCVN